MNSENLLLLVYPLLLFVLIFYKAKFSSKSLLPEEDFLFQSKMIRAGACVAVILHHLTQHVTNYGNIYKGPITIFSDIGILLTAVFFFFSGYGLLTSYNNKPDYLDHFLAKRLTSVLAPFWVVNIFWVICDRLFFYRGDTPLDMAKDIVGITLANGNGWFIVEIVIIYLLFYILFKKIKNPDVAMGILGLFVVAMIAFSFFQGHDGPDDKSHWFRGEWWYNSTITFMFGMLYARFKKAFLKLFEKFYYQSLAVSVVLFGVLLTLALQANRKFGYYQVGPLAPRAALITLLAQSAACISFCLMVLILSLRIKLGNPALKFTSVISLDLYLCHGYFTSRVFANTDLKDPAFYGVVIVCSFLCAIAMRVITGSLVKAAIPYFSGQRKKRTGKRNTVKRIAIAVAAVLTVFLFMVLRRYIFAGKEYKEEMKALAQAVVGSEVKWGHYDTDPLIPGQERLTWIVIDKKEGMLCLLSKEGIAGDVYNHKHEEVTWESSDLRALLNSSKFTGMFSSYERKSVVEESGDLITLLTPDEVRKIFKTDKQRELTITSAAEHSGTNINRLSKYNQWDMKGYRTSWWWLKGSMDGTSVYAPIVNEDGGVEQGTKEVNRPHGAIRPVIWVSID